MKHDSTAQERVRGMGVPTQACRTKPGSCGALSAPHTDEDIRATIPPLVAQAFLSVLLLLLAGCATSRPQLERGLLSPDTIEVAPVKNLAGVTLKVPEIYLGDAVGRAGELNVEEIDCKLLAEAAIYSRLDELTYRVALQDENSFPDGAKYEVHGAITHFDMSGLRSTGRFRMAMTVMLIDAVEQIEIARGTADEEFQLLDMAPDEIGAIGEQRFIETRMQIFIESLARNAVDAAGM